MSKQPLVATESIVIAHTMPCPADIETALAVKRIVRNAAAELEIRGILNFELVAVTKPDRIEHSAARTDVGNATRRDIPLVVSGLADTLLRAGGIGAVDSVANRDFNISSALPAAPTYRVKTCGAGATPELLETQRIPVGVWQSAEIPCVYSRRDGLPGWTVTRPALAPAQSSILHGKLRTPFLLGRIKQLTMGSSLTANITLARKKPASAPKSQGGLCA